MTWRRRVRHDECLFLFLIEIEERTNYEPRLVSIWCCSVAENNVASVRSYYVKSIDKDRTTAIIDVYSRCGRLYKWDGG